jgi:hypothetical protein
MFIIGASCEILSVTVFIRIRSLVVREVTEHAVQTNKRVLTNIVD